MLLICKNILAHDTEEVKKHVLNSIEFNHRSSMAVYADSDGKVNIDNEVICIMGKN